MAGDSQNMERSTLERKDRAELAAVADALGLKVPSRAKKADIITLILDVVAEPGGTAAPGPAPEAADHGGADDSAAGPAAEAASNTDDAPAAADDDAGSSDGASAPGAENDADGEGDAEAASAETEGGADGSGDADGDGAQEGSSRSRRRRRRGRDRAEGEGGTSEFEGEPVEVAGLLDLREDGYGFLRVAGFLPSREDVYVSVKQCRQLGLRKGDHLTGLARPAGHKEKNPALIRVETVNGLDPEQARSRPRFETLTPVAADEPLTLSGDTNDLTGAIIDRIAPINKGQRGLIASPPRSGKTTVVKAIATAVERNHPDAHLIVLLVDERPEDVTDVSRSVEADVVASTLDRPLEEHAAVAELTVEHAKRLVEYGNDVVVVVDGVTRLARAYNQTAPTGGRVSPSGLDAGALYPAKRFFGSGRKVEEGGSLTVLGTIEVETGSPLDAEIYDELARAANQVLKLDGGFVPTRPAPALEVGADHARQEAFLAALPAD